MELKRKKLRQICYYESMEDKIKKIVIIGNGMDISHNAKTKWEDIFSEYEQFSSNSLLMNEKIASIISNAVRENWYDFEKYIKTQVRIRRIALRNYSKSLKCFEREILVNYQLDLIKVLRELFHLIKDGMNEEEILEKIKLLDETDYWRDNTEKIKLQISEHIQNLLKNFKIEKQEKYESEFKDAFIINYNYTNWYENIYYPSESVHYIHGKINTNTDYETVINAEEDSENLDNILIGYYDDESDYSQTEYIEEDINQYATYYNLDKETVKKILSCWEIYIGNNNSYFSKVVNEEAPNKNEKGLHIFKNNKKFTEVEEITFIGHSLSENDLIPLFKKLKLPKLKNIKIIGWWESDQELVISIEKLSKILKDSKFDDIDTIWLNNKNGRKNCEKLNVSIDHV